MPRHESTSWDVIEGAASGDQADREEFVRCYEPAVREHLELRWHGSPLIAELEDALDEVFLECFRTGGALELVEAARRGGFRAFFFGVIRNVARRHEQALTRRRELPPPTGFTVDAQRASDTSLSRALDRAWAKAVLKRADARYRQEEQARGSGGERRAELLRLRFEEGLSIRAIAEQWNEDAAKLHQDYRRARRQFRRYLEEELSLHGQQSEDDAARLWRDFLSFLR